MFGGRVGKSLLTLTLTNTEAQKRKGWAAEATDEDGGSCQCETGSADPVESYHACTSLIEW